MRNHTLLSVAIAVVFTTLAFGQHRQWEFNQNAGQVTVGEGRKRPDTATVSGRQYRNEFFGFTYTFPEGFTVGTLPPAAMKFFDNQGSFLLLVVGDSEHPSSTGKLSSVVKVSAWDEQLLWGAAWREKTGGDYLRKLRTMPTTNLVPLGSVKEKEIAGRTFYEADAKTAPHLDRLQQGVEANLVTVERGFIVQFDLEAATQEELDKLKRSLESLVF